MSNDRVITVSQSWAHLLGVGVRKVIDVPSPMSFRGLLLLHADAKEPDADWRIICDDLPEMFDNNCKVFLTEENEGTVLPAIVDLPLGAIIGRVFLVDCVRIDKIPEDLADSHARGPWCLILERPFLFTKPYKCRAGRGDPILWPPPAKFKYPYPKV